MNVDVMREHSFLQLIGRSWIHPSHVAVDERHVTHTNLMQAIDEWTMSPGEWLEESREDVLAGRVARQEVVEVGRYGVVTMRKLGA